MTDTTKTRKASHRGICQVCGRLQKLPYGVMSIHGYTKEYGFFNGQCQGTDHQPIELSCDQIEAAITRATELLATAQAEQKAAVENKTMKGLRRREYHNYGGYKNTIENLITAHHVYHANYECDELQWEGEGHPHHGTIKLEDAQNSWLYWNTKRIEKISEYLTWQKNRLANWEAKPENLQPIK